MAKKPIRRLSTELAQRMKAVARNSVEARIPFSNEDVPKYLRELREFRERSKQARIRIK